MGSKVSTCLYINKEVLETAKQVGLNASKVSENALLDAIRRLMKPEQATSLQSLINIEGRRGDLNPCARLSAPERLHRPVGYQATSPRPPFPHSDYFCNMPNYVFERISVHPSGRRIQSRPQAML